MAADIDIWRTAQIMIKRHGEQAAAESEKCALQLDSASEPIGAATFRQINAAICELLRQSLSVDGHVQ